jgi:cytochrome c oxidase cbb3-type subunit 1
MIPVGNNRELQFITGYYSFGWLLAANLVGVLLALLLVFPGLGSLLGPLGYGRWMPLHMDWQLYGWCSLPLVGFLMNLFMDKRPGMRMDAHLGFGAWSAGLLVLGIMCLAGMTSGKLFLNWTGLSRIVFPAAQVLLWALLAGYSWRRYRERGRLDLMQGMQVALLVALLASPIALWLTADPSVYPPIDPDSGGATGHSLLASTLGIIFVFGFLPVLLGTGATPRSRLSTRLCACCFMASLAVWAFLGHGNESNTQAGQIAGLAVLLGWIPVVGFHYTSFRWPPAIRMWLKAFLFWWALLVVSGFVDFLPGVLDHLKFTNAMVAHAHLAMAGMLSAFNMLILASIGRMRAGEPWADVAGFWIWNTGTAVYVTTMMMQGVREGADPLVLARPDTDTVIFYSARLVAGLLLAAASVRWLILLTHETRNP